MAHFEHVTRVIFAKVKPPIKPLARPDLTPPKQAPLLALNVHLERMPILMVPQCAKTAATMPTNQNPMRQNAFQCKKGSTNLAQQLKSNARPVKQEAVAKKSAKIA